MECGACIPPAAGKQARQPSNPCRAGMVPPAKLLVTASRCGPGLEVLVRDRRQLLNEGGDAPDFLVGHLDRPEARHARHVNSVLDHPKHLCRRAVVDELFEVGWIRAHAFGKLSPFYARTSVTVGAAPLPESARPAADDRRIIE